MDKTDKKKLQKYEKYSDSQTGGINSLKKNHKCRQLSTFTFNCELRYVILHTVPECYEFKYPE